MSQPVTSSGSLAVGTNIVINQPALLHSIILNPGSAASSVTVYENASAASGLVLGALVGATSGSSVEVAFNAPIYSRYGLTVVVAGTAATAIISYKREN